MRHPLEGVRILDFTYLLPGPFGTMMLADLGADIIKVENINNPDLMRLYGHDIDGVSAAYAHINRGKKSLGLDLKKEQALDIIYRLVREYDIVVEQFRPGVMDKLGLGYEKLRSFCPPLIYCSLTGYGQTGSYSGRAGHDINYLALSSMESYSGRKGEVPSLKGIQIADICGGSKNLAIAVLAASLRRARTGEGDFIDISITDSTFALTSFQASVFLAGGDISRREEDILNGGSIYDYYETSDGRYLSVGPLEPKFAENFYTALGMPEMAAPLLMSQEQMSEVKRNVTSIIASKPLSHWLGAFRNIDACVEPVYDMKEAIANPPLSERGMVECVSSASGREIPQVSNPIKFASGPCTASSAGVCLGFNNREILSSLGYTGDDIAHLAEKGVINAC
jgi:alpha-methylacyl-CoA racemase